MAHFLYISYRGLDSSQRHLNKLVRVAIPPYKRQTASVLSHKNIGFTALTLFNHRGGKLCGMINFASNMPYERMNGIVIQLNL